MFMYNTFCEEAEAHGPLNLSGEVLQTTDCLKILGVKITKDLKWDSHINQCVSKAKRVLGLVCRNLRSCNTDLKATAYKSLVRPHLEYSCSVWDPTTNDSYKSWKLCNDGQQDLPVVTTTATAVLPRC